MPTQYLLWQMQYVSLLITFPFSKQNKPWLLSQTTYKVSSIRVPKTPPDGPGSTCALYASKTKRASGDVDAWPTTSRAPRDTIGIVITSARRTRTSRCTTRTGSHRTRVPISMSRGRNRVTVLLNKIHFSKCVPNCTALGHFSSISSSVSFHVAVVMATDEKNSQNDVIEDITATAISNVEYFRWLYTCPICQTTSLGCFGGSFRCLRDHYWHPTLEHNKHYHQAGLRVLPCPLCP